MQSGQQRPGHHPAEKGVIPESKFIRAISLALLYMDSEQWDRAERELHKCMDIDRNNTLTLRYLKEVETQLTPDENSKQTGRRKRMMRCATRVITRSSYNR